MIVISKRTILPFLSRGRSSGFPDDGLSAWVSEAHRCTHATDAHAETLYCSDTSMLQVKEEKLKTDLKRIAAIKGTESAVHSQDRSKHKPES